MANLVIYLPLNGLNLRWNRFIGQLCFTDMKFIFEDWRKSLVNDHCLRPYKLISQVQQLCMISFIDCRLSQGHQNMPSFSRPVRPLSLKSTWANCSKRTTMKSKETRGQVRAWRIYIYFWNPQVCPLFRENPEGRPEVWDFWKKGATEEFDETWHFAHMWVTLNSRNNWMQCKQF